MAKKVAKKVTKKRVKKNIDRGQAHIQSSFNNTIVTLTDMQKEMQFPGQVQVDLDSEDPENPHLMQHRWLQRQQQKLHCLTV